MENRKLKTEMENPKSFGENLPIPHRTATTVRRYAVEKNIWMLHVGFKKNDNDLYSSYRKYFVFHWLF